MGTKLVVDMKNLYRHLDTDR